MFKNLFSIALVLCTLSVYANGFVTGTILDQRNNETLIGATVTIEGTTAGAVTDLDGFFRLSAAAGTYSLKITYISYETKTITDVVIKEGETMELGNIFLAEESATIEPVVITAKANRAGNSNLLNLQSKAASIVSGISQEDIKKSPDRNTADVLKRVSGTSIQDNKFVVIRGLSDRYNATLINGLAMPSTEPDRRAFSFDIFPSTLLDNLIIYKTATPDLPGEFAGGVIQLNTKEIPQKSFFNVSLGTSYNSLSTFQSYKTYEGSKTDWLGFDKGVRNLDASIPDNAVDFVAQQENPTTRYELSKLFKNTWAVYDKKSMAPSGNVQLSGGTHINIKGKDLGVVGALIYSNSNRTTEIVRSDIQSVDTTLSLFNYSDKQYRHNVSVGGLLNVAMEINPTNRILLNNTFNQSGDDATVYREGKSFENGGNLDIKSYSMQYNSNLLYSSQLIGEHATANGSTKIKWATAYSIVSRNTPDYRRITYTRSFEDGNTDSTYYTYIPLGSANLFTAGRFFSKQKEAVLAANVDASFTFKALSSNQVIKTGVFIQKKDKTFTPRVFGYVRDGYSVDLSGTLDSLFNAEHINAQGFAIEEVTQLRDAYKGGSDNFGGYAMIDFNFTKDLKFIGGVRSEVFTQRLETNDANIRKVDTTFLDVLPSGSLNYSLSEKSKIRLAFSQTVARPSFREIAPFTFFDFNTNYNVLGNPALVRTKVTNIDLRYEMFPGKNQMLSVTGFYKHFKNPIEEIADASAYPRSFSYTNIPTARSFGVELEGRMNFGFIKENLEALSVFANAAYIASKSDISSIPGALTKTSQLQGQSPYIVNCGISYTESKSGVSATFLYNQVGKRIWKRGINQYKDIIEGTRPVLDFQLSKKFLTNGEIKLTIGDLLARQAVFYQDWNGNGKFDSDKDVQLQGLKFGTTVSLTLGYQF